MSKQSFHNKVMLFIGFLLGIVMAGMFIATAMILLENVIYEYMTGAMS